MSTIATVPTPETTTAPEKTECRRAARRCPGDVLATMQAQTARLFGERPLFSQPLCSPPEPDAFRTPRTDVFERNGTLVVEAELPGMTKDDIDIALEDGDLVVRGERKAEENVEEQDYYRMERSSGSFYRRLPLPNGVKGEDITASLKDGVLEILILKPANQAAPTKIPIA